MLGVRNEGEATTELLPGPISRNRIEIFPEDGQCRAYRANSISLFDPRRHRTIASLKKADASLLVTDCRVTFACSAYDKGSSWWGIGLIGVSVALTATAVSKARAAHRRQGKMLVGQVRYAWLRQVTWRQGTWLVAGWVQLAYLLPEHGELRMTIGLPRQTEAKPLAQRIIAGAATFQAKAADDPEWRERLRSFAANPPERPFGQDMGYRLPTAPGSPADQTGGGAPPVVSSVPAARSGPAPALASGATAQTSSTQYPGTAAPVTGSVSSSGSGRTRSLQVRTRLDQETVVQSVIVVAENFAPRILPNLRRTVRVVGRLDAERIDLEAARDSPTGKVASSFTANVQHTEGRILLEVGQFKGTPLSPTARSSMFPSASAQVAGIEEYQRYLQLLAATLEQLDPAVEIAFPPVSHLSAASGVPSAAMPAPERPAAPASNSESLSKRPEGRVQTSDIALLPHATPPAAGDRPRLLLPPSVERLARSEAAPVRPALQPEPAPLTHSGALPTGGGPAESRPPSAAAPVPAPLSSMPSSFPAPPGYYGGKSKDARVGPVRWAIVASAVILALIGGVIGFRYWSWSGTAGSPANVVISSPNATADPNSIPIPQVSQTPQPAPTPTPAPTPDGQTMSLPHFSLFVPIGFSIGKQDSDQVVLYYQGSDSGVLVEAESMTSSANSADLQGQELSALQSQYGTVATCVAQETVDIGGVPGMLDGYLYTYTPEDGSTPYLVCNTFWFGTDSSQTTEYIFQEFARQENYPGLDPLAGEIRSSITWSAS